MRLVWHLVKKDLHRLRVPVALFTLLAVGKLSLYAAIGGLFRAPDFDWLNRLQQGPEFLLRVFGELFIAYFLVGWLVFEDSPIEKDAHWITRPISGSQLCAAKLLGAGLMFVLPPLAFSLVWWVASGLTWPEIAVSAVEQVLIYSVLVAMAVACASLTGGFPRFVLWSLVALGSFAMVQVIFTPQAGPGLGLATSRLMVWWVSGGVVALALAIHQFVTRRHRRSLTFTLVGILLVGGLGGAWRWNFTNNGRPRLGPERGDSQSLQVKIIGPARYRHYGGQRYFAELTLQMADIPTLALVTHIKAKAQWSFGGTTVWNSQVRVSDDAPKKDAVGRLLGFKGPAQANSEVTLSLPFSPRVLQRTTHEPIAVQADIDLDLFRGKKVAELPLREESAPAGARSYTTSYLYNGPLKQGRPGKAPGQNAVGVVLTERSADGLLAKAFTRPSFNYYVLVNRHTGEFFLSDPASSGPMAQTTLNQTRIVCWQLAFHVGATPVNLEAMTLLVFRFGDGELINRHLEVDPIPFVGN
jgi:hypothetical protein